jgi:hypothetical protein
VIRKAMSYATMQDVLFALDLTDSELRDRPELHLYAPEAQPELPEERRVAPRNPTQRRGRDASRRVAYCIVKAESST